MFTFSLAYLLIPFALIWLFAAIFFFFNIFHIRRYAIQGTGTTLVLVGYTLGFLALTLVAIIYLMTVNWKQHLQPTDLIPDFVNTQRL